MKTGTIFFIGLLVVAAILVLWKFMPAPAPPAEQTYELDQPLALAVLLDDTASYLTFKKAIELLCMIVKRMNPLCTLYVIRIDSWVVEPDDLLVEPDQQLLNAARKVCDKHGQPIGIYSPEIKDYQNNVIEQVSSLKSNQVRGTDIYGALMYASSILQGQPEGATKKLLIFSDMGDTEARDKELAGRIDFSGVEIDILFFPTVLIKSENQVFKPDPNFWSSQLQAWGADSVSIRGSAASISFDPILGH